MSPVAIEPSLQLLRGAVGIDVVGDRHDDLVAREGLEGLLYARRQQADASVSRWKQTHLATAADNLSKLHQLAGLLRRLPAAVRPVVLPGASLLRLYPDAGCRPMDDVDLLAPPGAHDALCAGLRSIGMESDDRHPDLWQLGTVTVDVHTDLVNGERIRWRRVAGWLDPEQAWQRRQRTTHEGQLWLLSREDEILYTAAHALRHSYRRLTWLVDLFLQVHQDDVDWDQLRRIATEARMGGPLLDGLWLLRQGGLTLPDPAAHWLRREGVPPSVQWFLRRVLAARATTCAGEVLLCLSGARGLDRARLLAEFLFPRPEVLRQVFPRLPRQLALLAYPLRCGQLVTRGLAELATAVRGGVRT